MNSSMNRRACLLAFGVALLAVTAMPAHAVLVHRYTFNSGNANDSVGNANATVVDAGAPTAVFTAGGQLDLSANTGQASNAVTEDAYVNLPNGIIQSAAQNGTSGALSLEWWFTVATTRQWSRLGDFAGPLAAGGSEDVTNNGAVSYILITPNSGRAANGVEMTNNVGGGVENMLGINSGGDLPIGVQHHVVAVYDKNNTNGGLNLGGTMNLYVDGASVVPGGAGVNGSGAIAPEFDLNNLNDEDDWLGRSQWPDPTFDGSFNEFSIYDHAMTQAEVTTNFNAGPVPVPLPTLIVNKNTGAVAIKNNSPSAVTIDYYDIASAMSALNPAQGAWNSLDDQNLGASSTADFNNSGGAVNAADLAAWRTAFGAGAGADADKDGDTDGNDFIAWQRQLGQSGGATGQGFDEGGGISNQLLVELSLLNGTTMAPSQQISLGTPYRTNVFGAANGDLVFRFGIKGEAGLTNGLVQYVTTGPASGVPEPTGIAASVLALAGLASMRRRR